ncbi:hypothetical protein AALP_AAs48002U000200 [Arabis alpina]|uniref:Uncharacterized protein n=1 Tax=Arabis alpina TaxID=50452 RepID=A0A087FYR5_ARAAL|nr:hypothetical protein AALP_AAs48002U000200 [Arabis alpina]
MERPRSFRSLAPKTTGSGNPPTPTTVTTSTAPTPVPAPAKPTTAPASAKPTTTPASAKPTTVLASAKPTTALPSEPCNTSSAKKTTTTSKGSRHPSVTRAELVAALPAPLPSNYEAKRTAKGKGHEGDDRKRSSDRDDVIDVDRESKRARTRFASPPRRVSKSLFQDKASASRFFSTLVLSDDVVAPIDTKSSREMMRHGLKFLALVNKVGHELEAEVEDLKKQVEDEKRPEARKSAAALLAEAEKSVIALTAAEKREQYSDAIVKKRDGELSKVVDRLRRADEQIQSLERKFARPKDKFDELQGDPQNNMVYQVQRVANLDFVRLLLGLLDGHEPPKLEDELTFPTADVAEHAGDEERFEQLMKSLHGLLHVLDPKVKVPAVVTHDRTLKTYAASVGVADPSGSLLGGAGSCKAAVVSVDGKSVDGKFSLIGGVGAEAAVVSVDGKSVDGKFSLIGGVGAEVTKSRIEDVAKGAGTVGAPEEMRMDEDSQGPRIDALIEDPRVDNVFGVDEETVS